MVRRARDNLLSVTIVVVSLEVVLYLATRSGARRDVVDAQERTNSLLEEIRDELHALRETLERERPIAASAAPATEANSPPAKAEGEHLPTEDKRQAEKPKRKSTTRSSSTRRRRSQKPLGILAELKKGWEDKGAELEKLTIDRQT